MNCPTRSSLWHHNIISRHRSRLRTDLTRDQVTPGQMWWLVTCWRECRLLCPPGPALITINTKSCSLRGITTPVCIHMSLSLSDKQKISPRGRLTLTSVVQVLLLVMLTEGTPTHLTRREAAPLLSRAGPFTNILPAGGHSHHHHHHHQHEPVLHLQIPLRYIPPW